MSVLSILQQFYTYVSSLSSALDRVSPSWKEEGQTANAAYAEGMLIASNAPELVHASTVPTFVREKITSQRELINRVIEVR